MIKLKTQIMTKQKKSLEKTIFFYKKKSFCWLEHLDTSTPEMYLRQLFAIFLCFLEVELKLLGSKLLWRAYSVPPVKLYLFLSISSVCFSPLMSVSVPFCQFLPIPICFSPFMSISACFCLFKSVLVCFCLF